MIEFASLVIAVVIALCVIAIVVAQEKLRDRNRDGYIHNAPPIGMGPDGELNLLKPGEKPPMPRIIGNGMPRVTNGSAK